MISNLVLLDTRVSFFVMIILLLLSVAESVRGGDGHSQLDALLVRAERGYAKAVALSG